MSLATALGEPPRHLWPGYNPAWDWNESHPVQVHFETRIVDERCDSFGLTPLQRATSMLPFNMAIAERHAMRWADTSPYVGTHRA